MLLGHGLAGKDRRSRNAKWSDYGLRRVFLSAAHELGHWKMKHTISQLVIAEIHLFIFFFSFGTMLGSKGRAALA